jgi:hypothetical protein
VTESEWLGCTDIYSMLEFLYGRASERKLRLFGCAAVRRIWKFVSDERAVRAVEVAEQFADGHSSAEVLAGASHGATVAAVEIHRRGEAAARDSPPPRRGSRPTRHETTPNWFAAGAAAAVASSSGRGAAGGGSEESAHAAASTWHRDGDAVWRNRKQRELRQQLPLVRDIFVPFGGPRGIDPAWLAWNGSAVERLARAAYEERRLPEGTLGPPRLALLADALEDAGCVDPGLLGHLRGPGPHVRGCWALDLLLGKG